MKRVLIGGFLSLIGTILGVGALLLPVLGTAKLTTTLLSIVAAVLVGFGLGILVYEFFRKEKKQ